MSVTASSHQRSGPLTIKSPSTKRKQMMAPTYTGPLVKG